MRNVVIFLISLVTWNFISISLHAETADDFLKAYFLIQDGDAADKGSEKEKAVEKYSLEKMAPRLAGILKQEEAKCV